MSVPQMAERVERRIGELTLENKSVVVTHPVQEDGKIKWVQWKVTGTFYANGELKGASFCGWDITNEQERTESILSRLQRLKEMMKHNTSGLEWFNKEGLMENLEDVNPKTLDIFGPTNPQELIGFNIFKDPNFSPADREKLQRGEVVSYTKPFDFSLVPYSTSKKGIRTLNVQAIPTIDERGVLSGYLVIVDDVTEREENRKSLEYASTRDELTGLRNRAGFNKEKNKLDLTKPFAIAIGDIDGLKSTNDSKGHSEGDRLIKTVAHVLQDCVRAANKERLGEGGRKNEEQST